MSDLILSLVTLPVLSLYVTVHKTQAWLTETGQWSEELFRGDRLPPIHFPTQSIESPEKPAS